MIFNTIHMKIKIAFVASFLMIFTSSAMNTSITPYNEERDLKAIEQIFSSAPHYLFNKKVADPLAHAIGFIKAHGKVINHGSGVDATYKTYVINCDNKPVGFVQYLLNRVDTIKLRQGVINFLGIDQEYRSRGLGKILLESAIADLKNNGVTYIMLSVIIDNIKARKLYERVGFQCGATVDSTVGYIMMIEQPSVDAPLSKL